MPEKTALITGVGGQDGSYLAALLLEKGYAVHGTSRQAEGTSHNHEYLHIAGRITIHHTDLGCYTDVESLVAALQPDLIFHLAAESSVAESLKNPYPTLHFNLESTLNLLEATVRVCPHAKFFHASSCEIFGYTTPSPLSVESPLKPTTPYGASKAAAHLIVQSYRTTHGLFAVNGILFPHESPLRRPEAFTKSLVKRALALQRGGGTPIVLGQIENARDFGSAKEYVAAMWQSLQVPTARDYIIGTGTATTIKDMAYYVVDKLGVPRSMITQKPDADKEPITHLYADTTDTSAVLGWHATTTIYAILDEMIAFENQSPE